MSACTEIMMRVQRHGRYFDHAKAKFATGADGWLVACARVRGAAVVTNELQANPITDGASVGIEVLLYNDGSEENMVFRKSEL